jgi:cold shock CspA family protein
MPQGRIKFFNGTYGFIEPLAPGLSDVFVHASVLKDIEVDRGTLVDFDTVESRVPTIVCARGMFA